MTTPLLPTPRPDADRYGVLFVCLGNICRSPMAEGIFLDLAARRGLLGRLDVDSCGLGSWHVGGPADPRTIEACRRRGVAVPSIARLWDPRADPDRFDLVIPMDRQNHAGLLSRGATRERLRMMRLFDPEAMAEITAAPAQPLLIPDAPAIPDVPDPYTGPDSGFDRLFDMLHRACDNLARRVELAIDRR